MSGHPGIEAPRRGGWRPAAAVAAVVLVAPGLAAIGSLGLGGTLYLAFGRLLAPSEAALATALLLILLAAALAVALRRRGAPRRRQPGRDGAQFSQKYPSG